MPTPRTLLKYVAIAAGALVLLLVAIAAYIAATFDPNAYKPQLVALVKEKTGRTLEIPGDIDISFWPGIGAQVGRLSLSEPHSEQRFAAVESARVSLKLMPLLSRRLVVDELTVSGLRATLVRNKTGKTNVDDLIGGEPPSKQPQERAEPVAFDIAHVAIENAAVDYRDEATGAGYALSGLTLKTGRITPDVPTQVELKTAARSSKPKLDLTVDAAARLTFNLQAQRYALENLALAAQGQALEYTNVALKASGGVTADLAKKAYAADKLTVLATGTRGKEKLEARLQAPLLGITADEATGETLTAALTLAAPEATTTVRMSVPGIEGTAQRLRSSAVTLDLERRQPDRTVKANITSPLTGNVEARQLALPALKAAVTVSGATLPGGSLAGELSGSASVDGSKESAQAHLAGKVGESALKARLAVARFTPLAVNFDVDVDQLDLDRYTGTPAQPGAGDKPAAAPAAAEKTEQPLDLSALRELRANGTLRIGALTVSGIKANDVRVALRANAGRLDLDPLTARLYQGSLSGAVTVNAAPAVPAFTVKQTLTGVHVGPLLRDLADTDALEGRGNVSVNVTTQGGTVSALKQALDGTAAVKLVDGAVKGIDVAGAIRKAQAALSSLKGQPVQQASDARQRTDFTELSATFDIRDGVARNDDLSIKSPLLRIGGAGTVNIAADTLDYTVKAALVATTAGQGGKERSDLRGITVPVHVTGPIASPSYRLDFGAMVTDTARQKIEDAVTRKLEERLGGRTGTGSEEKRDTGRRPIEDSLRGLFGR